MLKTETITTCSDGAKFVNDAAGAARHEEALEHTNLIHAFLETEEGRRPGQKSFGTYTKLILRWEAFKAKVEEAEAEEDDTPPLEAVEGGKA